MLTVAVTGLNATDNPGPGVAVIQALRADPAFEGRIVGLAYDALDPGLYLPGLLDDAYLIPYPSAGREALFARLAHIQATSGLDVLIPTLDSELPALLDQEDRLAAMGIHTFLPTRAQYDLRSKAQLDRLRTEYDIAVPRGVLLHSAEQLYTLHETLPGPWLIKGVFYGAKRCHTVGDAIAAFGKHAAEWGLPVIAQEYVAGDDVNVCVVGDGEGGMVGAVCMKKILLTESGKGWAGVTLDDPALVDFAADVVAALKWRGPCEIEVRRDPQGGLHLIEINPRFPAWVDLTQGAGQNQPLAAVRLALGEDVGSLPPARPGTAFVRISTNTIVDITALEGIATVGQRLEVPA